MADEDSNTFYLEEVSIDEEDIDNMEYEEVAEDDDDDDEDDFGAVLTTLKSRQANGMTTSAAATTAEPSAQAPTKSARKAGLKHKPTVMDDFIRNFLIKLNMERTLDAFNTEWYEMREQGKLNEEDIEAVSDLYQRNESLDDKVKELREQVDQSYAKAEKARSTWDKFRKERDFHRMHHRRVVQEKNILIRDMKRLQKHYSSFEPALKAMRHKYELSTKDKTLIKLERDRLAAKVAVLEKQLASQGEGAEEAKGKDGSNGSRTGRSTARSTARGGNKPSAGTQKKRVENPAKEFNAMRRKGEAVLPSDNRVNPYLRSFPSLQLGRFGLRKTYKAHQRAVSGLSLHPTKPIVATVSDDMTWKMWSLGQGELIMSGDGHQDWIGACEFHPAGGLLATASGDGTVKIWDFVQARCTKTFTDHTQAVWDCTFHDTGDFLVSASMDHTARVFDVQSGRCRQTIRGHVDSINAVCFQPFSNNIATASGDKTVSLWDIRSGLCAQTFYGHQNAVLSCSFSWQGDTIVSSDSDGSVKLWDVRMVAERTAFQSRASVNDVKFDLSGKVVVSACDDNVIRLWSADDPQEDCVVLDGFEGPVQAVAVDKNGEFIIGAGSDHTFRMFQP